MDISKRRTLRASGSLPEPHRNPSQTLPEPPAASGSHRKLPGKTPGTLCGVSQRLPEPRASSPDPVPGTREFPGASGRLGVKLLGACVRLPELPEPPGASRKLTGARPEASRSLPQPSVCLRVCPGVFAFVSVCVWCVCVCLRFCVSVSVCASVDRCLAATAAHVSAYLQCKILVIMLLKKII